ncbi:uncharacterized protein LOC116738505 [Nasonia vitripennis]|uniref:Uncharacterized protein n=1 Tax=Nasonia vitripennis TaxID=7425 RepID=A0A7M7QR27_NASVI|nr:uncharacterized protein LOC116738505 [Nasonia vitripennis]
MPANYVSPDVKSTLTLDEIRQRYRDTSLVIFKEHQLFRGRRTGESEREASTYLSFGINRRTMAYSSNGNDPVLVHRSMKSVTIHEDENARLLSRVFRGYRKSSESCTIS